MLCCSAQLVILRQSLFELANQNVMMAAFGTVVAVTVGILALITSVVTGLMLAGVAQVSRRERDALDIRQNKCEKGSPAYCTVPI